MPDIIIDLTTGNCKNYFLAVPADEVAHVLDDGEAAELLDVLGLFEVGRVSGFDEGVYPSHLDDGEGFC
jgi:hypothetical protein